MTDRRAARQNVPMQRVEGVVRHYTWGDPAYLPRLLGAAPDGRPWAELWLGTHPAGPTRFPDGTCLDQVTGELPYLLKVLAAAAPLSLQTHPTATQARAGHAAGVFTDPHAKPELLRALTAFEALCGIRPVPATLALLAELGQGAAVLAATLAEAGPEAAISGLYRGTLDARPVVAACATSERPEARWARQLDARYPGEPSVAVTLLLNHVVLAPGEAIRFEPGHLHAYLGGAGVELMGASDNVVRGGLTDKPVDVDLLLATIDTTPLDDPVLPAAARHDLPAAGVALVCVAAGETHRAGGHELAIDTAGGQWYLSPGDRLEATVDTYVVTPL